MLSRLRPREALFLHGRTTLPWSRRLCAARSGHAISTQPAYEFVLLANLKAIKNQVRDREQIVDHPAVTFYGEMIEVDRVVGLCFACEVPSKVDATRILTEAKSVMESIDSWEVWPVETVHSSALPEASG